MRFVLKSLGGEASVFWLLQRCREAYGDLS
jgi:hypothetical protein